MMNILGITLWVLVTVGVLGFLGWSTNVLMAQKRAWEEFGNKYKLAVKKGKRFLDPVTVTGNLNGRFFAIYSQIEQSEHERTQRIYSHIEVYLNTPPATRCVISKKAMPEVLGDIKLPKPFSLTSADWPQLVVSMTDDTDLMTNWFTPVRVRALKGFTDLSVGDVETLLICDGDTGFLLWRSENPLRDPRELNALVQKLYGFVKDLDAGEAGTSAKPKADSAN